MAIPNPLIKFTYDDYLNAPEDKRYELLDGDLVALSSPEEFHQRVSILLGAKLVQFASTSPYPYLYLLAGRCKTQNKFERF